VNNVPAMIGKKIAKDNRPYTQVDIAKATGVSQSMISRIITNQVKIENVAYGVLVALADWLECDVKDLAYREKTKN
jgi:transcriptional regulator with XRE-family HTH domain